MENHLIAIKDLLEIDQEQIDIIIEVKDDSIEKIIEEKKARDKANG